MVFGYSTTGVSYGVAVLSLECSHIPRFLFARIVFSITVYSVDHTQTPLLSLFTLPRREVFAGQLKISASFARPALHCHYSAFFDGLLGFMMGLMGTEIHILGG